MTRCRVAKRVTLRGYGRVAACGFDASLRASGMGSSLVAMRLRLVSSPSPRPHWPPRRPPPPRPPRGRRLPQPAARRQPDPGEHGVRHLPDHGLQEPQRLHGAERDRARRGPGQARATRLRAPTTRTAARCSRRADIGWSATDEPVGRRTAPPDADVRPACHFRGLRRGRDCSPACGSASTSPRPRRPSSTRTRRTAGARTSRRGSSCSARARTRRRRPSGSRRAWLPGPRSCSSATTSARRTTPCRHR